MGLPPPYPFIYKKLIEGQVIPFLGAGAPLYNRNPRKKPWRRLKQGKSSIDYLPIASELAEHLAQEANVPAADKGELTKMAQYYESMLGFQPLRERLRDIFSHQQPPTPLHEFLASISAPLLVVTTNYDDLMERTFSKAGKPFDVVVHVTGEPKVRWWPHGQNQPKEFPPDDLDFNLSETTVVYKMHGAIDRRKDQVGEYVITEDDYIEFLTRMTRGSVIPKIFAPVFKERPFLFLGYGLYDWNLRVILNQVQQYRIKGQVKSWAIETQSKPAASSPPMASSSIPSPAGNLNSVEDRGGSGPMSDSDAANAPGTRAKRVSHKEHSTKDSLVCRLACGKFEQTDSHDKYWVTAQWRPIDCRRLVNAG